MRARAHFKRRTEEWAASRPPQAIIAACPFSFHHALSLRRPGTQVVYLAFEICDASLRGLARSPATTFRNWRALRRLPRADMVCAPSPERAGWLAGRARLDTLPETVLNAPYGGMREASATERERLQALLPPRFRGKSLVIHTGNVSTTQAITELIDSVAHWPQDVCLVVTSVGGSGYAQEVRRRVDASLRRADILLLPVVSRAEMLALQAEASVGLCLLRQGANLSASLPAPNKVGEYLSAGLVIVAPRMPYLDRLERHGVAVLSDSLSPEHIAAAVGDAIHRIRFQGARDAVRAVASSWYRMEVQLLPVLQLLRGVAAPQSV